MEKRYEKRKFGFSNCLYPGCGIRFTKKSGSQKYCNKHKCNHSERVVRKHEEKKRKQIKRENLREFIGL